MARDLRKRCDLGNDLWALRDSNPRPPPREHSRPECCATWRKPAIHNEAARATIRELSGVGARGIEEHAPFGRADGPARGIDGIGVHGDRGNPEPYEVLGELGAVRRCLPTQG